jgi:glycerol uptake facilitator-like aquaporin
VLERPNDPSPADHVVCGVTARSIPIGGLLSNCKVDNHCNINQRSFANPAVTLARGFTTTFAGIALGDVGDFVAAQLVGAAIGAWLSVALFPARETSSTHVIAPGE